MDVLIRSGWPEEAAVPRAIFVNKFVFSYLEVSKHENKKSLIIRKSSSVSSPYFQISLETSFAFFAF